MAQTDDTAADAFEQQQQQEGEELFMNDHHYQVHVGKKNDSLLISSASKSSSSASPDKSSSSSSTTASSKSTSSSTSSSSSSSSPLRILYIVTTLAEYNTGDRATVKGSDRLQLTLLPVLREGVESMIAFGYHVDVYLICHFSLLPHRFQLVQDAMPPSTKVEYWDNATPLGYSLEFGVNVTQHITRALARQHRFVIKERLLDYDVFCNFEDDMLIKGDHVQQFLKVTKELYRLRDVAPERLEGEEKDEQGNSKKLDARRKQAMTRFYGPMTKAQLSRMIPGFIRVEALLDEETYGAQEDTGPVPVNLTFLAGSKRDQSNAVVDPKPCCHVQAKTTNVHMPESPPSSKLFLWETGILALGVRQMPRYNTNMSSSSSSSSSSWMDWVVLQRGPLQDRLDPNTIIGDYWSGRDGYFPKESRPQGPRGSYVNNQGGWMATRRQIWEWHTELCPGGFLPPFDAPHYRMDGLDLRNVEYWSGGLNLFTYQHACNLQRIIPIHPDDFSRHLIYHTANNKQRQLKGKRKHFTKVDTMLGQLNTVRYNAERAMAAEQSTIANLAATAKQQH